MNDTSSVVRLRVDSLSKSYSGVPVLHAVSFEAAAGEVLGLVGENGSGKSTTMNILAGVTSRDAGEIRLDGELYAPTSRGASESSGVAFIQQELNVFPNLSVAENLFLGRYPRSITGVPIISRSRMYARAAEVLSIVELNVDPGTPAARLAPGERQLLEIARGLSTAARVMILDEPTTSLSARETARLFDTISLLRANGVAIIFISHALDDVLRLSDKITVLRDGHVTLTAKRGEVESGDLVKAMVGRSIQTLFPTRVARSTQPRDLQAPLLRVANVGEPGIVSDITFDVCAGEIVGIAGLMGSGRTELARILFGLDPHHEGRIHMNGRPLPSSDAHAAMAAGMAFLTEDRRHEGLMLDASVAENFALAALPMFTQPATGLIQTKSLAVLTDSLAKRLSVKSGEINSTAVRTLSGGNQQKVLLGRWLLRKPLLFILDEPTRGVDVGAKQDIYRLLAEEADNGMAILVISSELEELLGLCDRILVMRQGTLQTRFERAQFEREQILKSAFGQRVLAA